MLPTLAELQKMLTSQLSALENEIQAQNRELAGHAGRQRVNEESPLSVFARSAETRSALLGLVERAKATWEKGMQGSAELYWLQQLLSASLECELEALNCDELQYEMKLLFEVDEKFRKLIPQHVTALLPQQGDTGGKLAVALNEAQGKNAELAQRLIALENEEAVLNTRMERAEVASANAFAVGELCEFESRVLSHYLNSGSLPRQNHQSDGYSMPMLEQLRTRQQELTRQVVEAEADVTKLRETLVKAIDASEHPQAMSLSRQLFEDCEKIIRKYSENSSSRTTVFPF